MFSALLFKVKLLFGLEEEGRKRKLTVDPDDSPQRKQRRLEKSFGLRNCPTIMNSQHSDTTRSESRIRRSVLAERPELELCWEKKKPGKENQFHMNMFTKGSDENEIVEIDDDDDDVKIWRDVKPVRRGSAFLERKPIAVQLRRKVHHFSREEVHLDDTLDDDDVTLLKDKTRQEDDEILPSRWHSNLGQERSRHSYTTTPDISPIAKDTQKNPYQKKDDILSKNSSFIGGFRPSFGLLRHSITPLAQMNPKRESKSVSKLDSASVKIRIRSGNLSRAAILKQSLPPPPTFFGTEPKIAPKWAGLDPKHRKKPSALDVSSSIDEMKAYNQMLQQFTSDDKSAVSKMFSSGMECPAFKIFEPQLKRNFTYSKLLNRCVNRVEGAHKIDIIDLSKSDDDIQEVECSSSKTLASVLPKEQSISTYAHEVGRSSQKVMKVDVQRTREVTPKTSGESTQKVLTLPHSPPNVVDQMIKKSYVTDDDYIKDLMQRYSILKDDINMEMKNENMKKQLWSEKRQTIETLETKLRNYMKITDVSFDEVFVSEEEEKLPELTSEMLDMVHNALRKNRNCILARSGSNTITGADIQTLADNNWLNDEVINNYMDMLIQRGQSKEYPSVYAFNTFFYPRLSSSGYSSVKRWTKKIDIFQQDMVLVPLHLEVHWALAVIDFRQKTICYYDSMNGRKNNILQLILKYLQDEKMDKKKENFNSSGWQTKLIQDIPQQRNGYDCGVFACMFAEHLARGVAQDSKKEVLKRNRSYPPFPFSQDNMAYFRKRMIYEILAGKLLQ